MTSGPFTVGTVPAGYEPVVAGTGTAVGHWGSDSFGTVEPYAVLSPDGRAMGPDVVMVSITGFEGYQGGLAQASAGYLSESREDITIDGADAVYTPASHDDRGERWADLVVVRAEDLAVRVSSPVASREELTSIAERVDVPTDRTQAPSVPDPPDGLQLVGSVDVDGVLAAEPHVSPHTDQVPGPRSSHSVGWIRAASGGDDQLSVLTVPGRLVDLAALSMTTTYPSWIQRTARAQDVGGRPGLVTEEVRLDHEGWRRRSVLVESAWGDIVVVSATGLHVPAEEDLMAVAESVQPADEARWDEFVIEATGGPGLHADDGRTELARGQVGDLEWLLQDGPPGGGMMSSSETDPDSPRGIDPCLKLSSRSRVCARGGAGGGVSEDDWVMVAGGEGMDDRGGLAFVVVSTTVDVPAIRVTTPRGTATAPLQEVPAGGLWGAAVFVDDPGRTTCEPASGPPAAGQMRIDALGADGSVMGCLPSSGGLSSGDAG